MKNRPPMPNRDLGECSRLTTPMTAPPSEYVKLNEEFLLIITEKCTYRLQVADQIDPDRTNPALRRISAKRSTTAQNPTCYAGRCCRRK